MKVVASQRGFYGRMREVGEAFAIDNKDAFSKRWMVDVNKDKARAASLAEEHGKAPTLTADQIAAEEDAALGRKNGSLQRENAAMAARIEELEAEQAAPDAPAEAAPEETQTPEDAEPAGEPETPAKRPTRRTRR